MAGAKLQTDIHVQFPEEFLKNKQRSEVLLKQKVQYKDWTNWSFFNGSPRFYSFIFLNKRKDLDTQSRKKVAFLTIKTRYKVWSRWRLHLESLMLKLKYTPLPLHMVKSCWTMEMSLQLRSFFSFGKKAVVKKCAPCRWKCIQSMPRSKISLLCSY